MRTLVLIALILPLTSCLWSSEKEQTYAEANSLMSREIQSRIAEFPFQQGGELLNNMLWLQTKAGETAIPALLAALKHKDPKVRASSLWVLGRMRDRRTIPEIRALASDEHQAVRLEAARTLVTMGDLKYCTILIEALDSDKTSVRYNCHMALKDATKQEFDYDHLEEKVAVRQAAALRWRQWWAKQSSDPWFAESYAREHGLASPDPNAKPIGETGTKGTDATKLPGTNPMTKPGTNPDPQPGAKPATNPGANPGANPAANPGANPAANPDSSGFKPLPKPGGTDPEFKPLPKTDGKQGSTPGVKSDAGNEFHSDPVKDPANPKSTEKPAATDNPVFKLLDELVDPKDEKDEKGAEAGKAAGTQNPATRSKTPKK